MQNQEAHPQNMRGDRAGYFRVSKKISMNMFMGRAFILQLAADEMAIVRRRSTLPLQDRTIEPAYGYPFRLWPLRGDSNARHLCARIVGAGFI